MKLLEKVKPFLTKAVDLPPLQMWHFIAVVAVIIVVTAIVF